MPAARRLLIRVALCVLLLALVPAIILAATAAGRWASDPAAVVAVAPAPLTSAGAAALAHR